MEKFAFPSLKRLWIAHNPLKLLKSKALIEHIRTLTSVYCFNSRITNPLISQDRGLKLAATSKGNSLAMLKDYAEDAEFFHAVANAAPNETLAFENGKRILPFKKKLGKVFVSYSHKDKEFLERLQTHLKVLSYEFDFEIWDDTTIKTSGNWKEAIDQALNETTIAILLVSTDFLASDFVRNNELPILLKAADQKGTKICPVIVHPCRFAQTKWISQFQAANDPGEALSLLSQPRQEQIWLKLVNDIQIWLEEEKITKQS